MTTSTLLSSWKQELANAVTHGIGFLLSIPAMVMLVVFAAEKNNPLYLASFLVFGISMLLLYLFSTLLHSFYWTKVKTFLAILDHSAIYLLIAGTYTPIVLITLHGTLGWVLFSVVWGVSAIGIAGKCFLIHRFKLLSTMLYLIMGWLILIAIEPLYKGLSAPGFWLLFSGGICYSVGAVFYTWKNLPYSHAIWHIFVIAGSAFMYFTILFYV
ncbi:hemolysin III family protein [Heyndrickxia coagulans]|uniref:PAQR family membrane homeostasis protein TrhA n=1 Tax=Heyndrickxia coagulans TaxID=1398 RepID=UPI002164E48D|nr:hemolysin III family protein [Heyndrickxia coagulans]MEC5269668.1 hemolysin III family protein [Heyndrickxia coagulans]